MKIKNQDKISVLLIGYDFELQILLNLLLNFFHLLSFNVFYKNIQYIPFIHACLLFCPSVMYIIYHLEN